MKDEEIGYKAGLKYGEWAHDDDPPFGGCKTLGEAIDRFRSRGEGEAASIQTLQGFILGYFDGRKPRQVEAND